VWTDRKPGHSANAVRVHECPTRQLRKGKKDALVTRREFLELTIATSRLLNNPLGVLRHGSGRTEGN